MNVGEQLKIILSAVQVADVMVKKAISVHENDDFALIYEKMEEHHIRHLPVLNDAGQVAGLITQRILFKIHSPRKLEDGSWYYDKDMLHGFILSKVMIQNPQTVKPETTIREAADLFVRVKTGCLPVVDAHNYLKGVITRDDILRFLVTG